MRSIASYGMGFFKESAFDYQGNVHLALSGGRSSAAMLRLLLDVYGGALPANFHVLYTNTGKEHAETLLFLQRISDKWKVAITWLELAEVLPGGRAVMHKVVDFDTCSRNGEPFHILRDAKPNFAPHRMTRMCTVYLKVYVANAHIKTLAWDNWTLLYGYRSDEHGRLHKALLRCGQDKHPWTPDAPLIKAGIDKKAVLAFFDQSDFDLGVPDLCGNCTFCFLKDELKLRKLIQILPGEIDWWIDLEADWGGKGDHGRAYTILPYGGYAALKARALASMPPIEDEDVQDLECNCTD